MGSAHAALDGVGRGVKAVLLPLQACSARASPAMGKAEEAGLCDRRKTDYECLACQ